MLSVTDTVPTTVTSSANAAATKLSNILVVDGNSIGVGYPGVEISSGLYTSDGLVNPVLPADASNAPSDAKEFMPAWAIYNLCYSSRTMTAQSSGVSGNPTGHTQTGDFASNISPLLMRGLAAGCSNVVVLNVAEPGNMIYYDQRGAAGTRQSDAENSLTTYANLVKAAGAKFATMTLTSRANASSPNNTAATADILIVNTWMRANWSTFCSGAGFSDPASDSRFQDYTDSTYYADATHLTAAGYNALREYCEAAVFGAIAANAATAAVINVVQPSRRGGR